MATEAHCCFAFSVLESRLTKSDITPLYQFRALVPSAGDTTVNDEDTCPLFVTYDTLRQYGEKRLRGCIGTFGSYPLEQTLKQYAIVAALEDSRFRPIKASELESLQVSVSLLTDFEDIDDPYDWTLGTHGLQVHFMFNGRGRSATFLPDVATEQGWSQDDTLRSLFKKGGWDGSGHWKDLKFDMERYQSSKASVTYSKYKEIESRIR